MPDPTQITALIFAAVDEVNLQLRKSQRLVKSPDTVISGPGSQLDSLGLVNLIFAIEQLVEQQFQVTVALADESALSKETGPFHTLGSLAAHTHALVESKKHG